LWRQIASVHIKNAYAFLSPKHGAARSDSGAGLQVLSPAPNKYNPNRIFPVGDGFGLFVYFEKFEDTHFKNGIIKRPNSKPRRTAANPNFRQRKKKQQ